jgi:N-methylhydantoinase A
MRYVGQNFELSVEAPPDRLKPVDLETLISRFYVEHEKNYGHFMPGEPTQLVSFRVTARGIIPKLHLEKTGHQRPGGTSSTVSHREVYFNAETPVTTPVYDRTGLCPGDRIKGPAVIEQMDSTTLIYPEDLAEIDDLLNIIIEIKEGKA